MDEISAYLSDSDIEISGDPDILSEAYQDEEGDTVHEVGARARRRGRGGPFKYRRFRIPAGVIQRKMGAQTRGANRAAYDEPNAGGALTPFAVGRATPGAPTLIAVPQEAYQPLRMLVASHDTATGLDIGFRVRITDIDVGARSQLRAGGSPNGLPSSLFAQNWTGANPARYDKLAATVNFTVTFAGLVATDVSDVALVGRAG